MNPLTDRPRRITFPPFVLDAANARLYRGSDVVRVRGKTLAVLEHLALRPGQLVTKNELLEALWPETYVTETALAGCVRELRHALGDSRGEPQFIETVYGRGYRFIGEVSGESTVESRKPAPHRPATSHHIVGRHAELAQLDAALQAAANGHRQVVFIAGDAGIGKTALVNAFIAAVEGREVAAPLIARGQCIEQYGPGEPFLPLLEALTRLCRQSPDPTVASSVRHSVPRWLLSLPGESAADVEPPAGVVPERAMRFLLEAIEALAAAHTVVLLLEDLHWSDPSTLDVISHLAQRPDPARLLVIATYRPVDAIIRQHPLRVVEQELRARRRSGQLTVRLLSESAINHWLEGLCPQAPAALAKWLYQRTDGHPLFLSALLEDLRREQLVRHDDGKWIVSPRFAEVGVPQSLRLMINQQAERLPAEDRELLEAASAVGMQFSTAAVAAALERDTVRVEQSCSALARQGQFLGAERSVDWPDGTVAGGYAFLHALYQNVLYERLPPARRQQLHERIARRLESGYGAHAEDFAAELAVHFERGRDLPRAIRYRERAAVRCNQRGAHREAAESLRRALELVESLPESRERSRQVLSLLLMLGAALIPVEGYAAGRLEATFQRCAQLAEELGETPPLFTALAGLQTCYITRAQLDAASAVSERLLHLAEAMPMPIVTLLAHTGAGWARCCRGDLFGAREHLLQAAAVHADAVPLGAVNIDPATLATGALALTLLALGELDEARARMDAEIARCRRSERAIDRGTALVFGGMLYSHLGEIESAAAYSGEALALGAENGLREPPIARFIHTWSGAMREGTEAALATLIDGISIYRAAGFGAYLCAFFGFAAEAHGRAGKLDTALQLLDQATAHVESTGERWGEPELYRIRGELLARQPGGRRTGAAVTKKLERARAAEQWLERAIDTARQQGAKLWELRAAVSLARLRHAQGKTAAARAVLERSSAAFPAGQDSPDVRAAHALSKMLR